jgi:hypothetical protein
MTPAPLHERLRPAAFLVGRWLGDGRGLWSVEPQFRFRDEIEFTHDGRPLLAYRQRTVAHGRPSHGEMGYLTPSEDGFDFTVASPIGISEVLTGRVVDGGLEFTSVEIAHSPSTDNVTTVRRRFALGADDTLVVEVAIGVNGDEAAPHTASELRRKVP